MGVKADSHREANGTKVTGKGDGNVMTRLGARAAVRSNQEGGFANTYGVEPYLETNWIHNSKDSVRRWAAASSRWTAPATSSK